MINSVIELKVHNAKIALSKYLKYRDLLGAIHGVEDHAWKKARLWLQIFLEHKL